ncbi:hypothetical protein Tco_0371517 [Tanacetum coccineum]
MILNSVQNGPLIWPTIEENGVIRTKKYEELLAPEKLQADCDLKATNIILQGLPPDVYAIVNHHKVAKEIWDRVKLLMQGTKLSLQEKECILYDEFDKFSFVKVQVNSKFLDSLPPEWSKFVTDVKLSRDLHTTNYDQLPPFKTTRLLYNKFKRSLGSFAGQSIKVKDTWLGNALSLRGQGTLYDPDYDCDDVSNAKAVLMANLSNYGSDVISEVPHSEPYHNHMDNQSVHAMHDFEQIPVVDFSDNEITIDLKEEKLRVAEETLILEKIFGKRFVPQQELSTEQAFWFCMSNPSTKSFDASPVKVEDPKELPKVILVNESLKKIKFLLAKWLQNSNTNTEQSDNSPGRIEAPSKLPKVSLVNTSLKTLKFHLSKFDTVVKKRITPDAITEGEWGFEHTKAIFLKEIIPFLTTLKDIFNVFDRDLLNEITEVQTVFNQMEAAVQQYLVDKQCFEIVKKELFLVSDRLLQQIMSQDVLLSVMNSTTLIDEFVNLEMQRCESCDKCLDLNVELLKTQNSYNDLLKSYSQLEKYCISLELSIQLNQEIFQKDKSCDNQNALEILEYSKNNELKAQLQAKDTTICKLKEHIKSMRENDKEKKVKQDMNEIATINIDLEHNLDPLAPRLLKNTKAHIDYLKNTQEQADILQGIVKQAKAKQPLDNALDFGCKHAKRIQELLVYVQVTCPNAYKPSEKLIAVTPINKVKKIRFSKPLTSSSNIKQVESSKTSDSNTPVLPST